jgi:hypothetical protein
MKVAVILTGALRTIKKTMRYFKQNVLTGPDVHVFTCLQNDTAAANAEWDIWLSAEIGDALKSCTWFIPADHGDWFLLRDRLLTTSAIPESWKNYLKNSGSIIEYYQLYLAYQKMCNLEFYEGEYDYIVRCRTDTIFAKAVDFHWLRWTDAEVQVRLSTITAEMQGARLDTTPLQVFNYFMATILSDSLIPNTHNIMAEVKPSEHFVCPEGAAEVNKFLNRGSYILTIRANNLYIVRRGLFNFIPSLGHMYGLLTSPYSDDYWFNSENQFVAACYHSGLTVFDYNTLFEDKSLYEYDEKRYFDLDFNILNPYMLYCVVRS